MTYFLKVPFIWLNPGWWTSILSQTKYSTSLKKKLCHVSTEKEEEMLLDWIGSIPTLLDCPVVSCHKTFKQCTYHLFSSCTLNKLGSMTRGPFASYFHPWKEVNKESVNGSFSLAGHSPSLGLGGGDRFLCKKDECVHHTV